MQIYNLKSVTQRKSILLILTVLQTKNKIFRKSYDIYTDTDIKFKRSIQILWANTGIHFFLSSKIQHAMCFKITYVSRTRINWMPWSRNLDIGRGKLLPVCNTYNVTDGHPTNGSSQVAFAFLATVWVADAKVPIQRFAGVTGTSHHVVLAQARTLE